MQFCNYQKKGRIERFACLPSILTLLQAVSSGEIKIVPERFEKVYNRWLENIKDWCISRQLWWGHRIPVYYVFQNQVMALLQAKRQNMSLVCLLKYCVRCILAAAQALLSHPE